MRQVKGTPLPLGVTVREDRINFSMAVPAGKECSLKIYVSGNETPDASFPMEETVGEVRFLAVEGLNEKRFEYIYEIGGVETVDPYARELSGRENWEPGTDGNAAAGQMPGMAAGQSASVAAAAGQPAGVIAGKPAGTVVGQSAGVIAGKPAGMLPAVSLTAEEAKERRVRGVVCAKEYDWEGDAPLHLPYHKVVAYSLHVRGFTKDASSKAKKKGTFEGVVEKIPYLKDLGINQIHCMPVYEFEERGMRCNYWGYGAAYCFAPKSAYSAKGDGAGSLKDMVKACHKAGIEVVLEMPFDPSITRQMMEECLRVYVMEYHIDGFILNPLVAPVDAVLQDPILKGTKILRHRTEFRDTMRRFLKGDEGMVSAVIYWLRHTSEGEGIFNAITGQSGFTLCDLVSYDGKHNENNGENNRDGTDYNFSWNCGAEGTSRKKEVVQLRRRQMRNAYLLTLLAQGTPCILAGDEFENSQKGNNNAYCQDNPIGWVNWGKLKSDRKLHDFVKRLIEIRKTYPVFCPEKEMLGIDRSGCGVPDVSYHGENAWRTPTEVSSRLLGVYYSGAPTGTADCFVAYNLHWLPHQFALPSLTKGKKWQLLISTDADEPAEEPLEDQKYLKVEARTIAVLVSR